MANSKKKFSSNQKPIITGIIILSIAILSLASLFSSATGIIGRILEESFNSIAGLGRYFLPLFIFSWGLQVLLVKRKRIILRGTFLLFTVFLLFVISIHFGLPVEKQNFSQVLVLGYQGNGGGLIGGILSFALIKVLGRVGSYILLVTLTIVLIVVFLNQSLRELLDKTKKKLEILKNSKKKVIPKLIEKIKEEKELILESPVKELLPEIKPLEQEVKKVIINTPIEPKIVEVKMDKEKVEISPNLLGSDYCFPDISLLSSNLKPKSFNNSKELNENIKILEQTLENFGVKAKVVEVLQGPTITRYELQPPPGVKVSKIVNLTDDLSLALAASGVRIEAPVPGKAVVGIEVPNKETSMVCLREIISTDKFQNALSKLTVALGKDIAGNPIIADLAKMPHLLIAGTTGSGKSVCVNTLITSILYKAKPDEVKFLLIDPKMVELTSYNGIPHLISPVVTQARKAASALKWAVQEMEKRYLAFAEAGVRNIEKYNEAGNSLPYIVVVIDELADLMMVAPNDVEDAICRLAQMARAAGLHLVVATQRPSVDVITGVIKSNIASRIAFAVSSQIDSRTILDMGGAEKLLGKGDMLFSPIGSLRPLRVQGAFISDKEVEGIVNFLKEQGIQTEEEEITLVEEKEQIVKGEEEDNLFSDAVKVVLESKQASVSLLQRRLRVGYARAARLMDLMEMKGIVGPYEGSKPRTILINAQHLEALIYEENSEVERNMVKE